MLDRLVLFALRTNVNHAIAFLLYYAAPQQLRDLIADKRLFTPPEPIEIPQAYHGNQISFETKSGDPISALYFPAKPDKQASRSFFLNPSVESCNN